MYIYLCFTGYFFYINFVWTAFIFPSVISSQVITEFSIIAKYLPFSQLLCYLFHIIDVFALASGFIIIPFLIWIALSPINLTFTFTGYMLLMFLIYLFLQSFWTCFNFNLLFCLKHILYWISCYDYYNFQYFYLI